MENITVTGNVGKTPELKVTAEGKPFLNVSLASSRWDRGQNGGKGAEVTIWYNVSFWEKDAERAERLISEGATKLIVTGRIMQRSYKTKDGREGVSLEIRPSDFDVAYNASGRKRAAGEVSNADEAVDPVTGEVIEIA